MRMRSERCGSGERNLYLQLFKASYAPPPPWREGSGGIGKRMRIGRGIGIRIQRDNDR